MKKINMFLIILFLFDNEMISQNYPTPLEGDYVIKNFEFENGEKIYWTYDIFQELKPKKWRN